MKKFIFIILTMIFIPTINALPFPVDITADSAMLINVDDKVVVYEKNPDKKQIIASLTKIMTAYTVINNVEDLNAPITITEEDIANLEGFTIIGLKPEDVVTYKDLLYGLLLQSGADAAQALAYHTSGDPKTFVELMNKEAKKIDLRNSNFADSYGGDDANVSTARDIGILLKEALSNELFNKIFKTDYYTTSNDIQVTNYTKNLSIFHGFDTSLITGSKSGYTPEAGLLLASTAIINNKEYVIIVMKSKENEKLTTHVIDTYKIINYIKEHQYENRLILKKKTSLKEIKVENSTIDTYIPMIDRDIYLFLNEEEVKRVKFDYNITKKIDNTFEKGDNLGFVDITVDGEVLYTYDVYLDDNLFEQTSPSTILVSVLALLIIAIFVLIFINILLGKN